MKLNLTPTDRTTIIATVSILATVFSFGYGIYSANAILEELERTDVELASTTFSYEAEITKLSNEIARLEEEKAELNDILSDEQKRVLDLEHAKRRNEREINTLTKLTTLDPELLKKYSKVYFLSENYTPPDLEVLETKFVSDPTKKVEVLEDIYPFLKKLMDASNKAGLSLKVLSGYRSYEYQKDLKSDYNFIYGAGANQFSADQGYSEHQLGTTIDFTTPIIKGADVSFETTSEFKWLTENAYKYGFVLSYPKGNAYYVYEPWHWRFVGEELADDLHDDGKYLYELDQREIDEYLLEIFD